MLSREIVSSSFDRPSVSLSIFFCNMCQKIFSVRIVHEPDAWPTLKFYCIWQTWEAGLLASSFAQTNTSCQHAVFQPMRFDFLVSFFVNFTHSPSLMYAESVSHASRQMKPITFRKCRFEVPCDIYDFQRRYRTKLVLFQCIYRTTCSQLWLACP